MKIQYCGRTGRRRRPEIRRKGVGGVAESGRMRVLVMPNRQTQGKDNGYEG